MKRSGTMLALTVSNVALLAVVAWQSGWLRSSGGASSRLPTAMPSGLVQASSSGSGVELAPLSADLQPSAHAAPPTAQRTNAPSAFDWRRVESADYRSYIQNLRAIGCPDQTVRDIVTADVIQNFAAKRRAAAAAAYGDFKYWEAGEAAANRRAELAQRRRTLDEQMTSTLGLLLGTETPSPEVSRAWQAAVSEQQLAFLPAEKRAQAVAVLERDGACELAIPPAAGDRLAIDQAEDLRQRLELFDRKKEQLSAVLTPEEYEQVDMTVSWTADNLRRAMTKFQPTEAEFQAIFREWRAHDEQIARLWAAGEPDPGNAQVFARIRERLGEQRFEEYRSTWWK